MTWKVQLQPLFLPSAFLLKIAKKYINIGNNVKIGGGSGVIKDIKDNQIVMGYPAVSLKISKPFIIFASSANDIWFLNKKEKNTINKNFKIFINLF